MKYILIVSLVINCTYNNISAQVAVSKTPGLKTLLIPKVRLVYQQGGTVFDRTCGTFLNKPIKQEWIDETVNRMSEFQELWDKEAPHYLKTALEATGHPFPYEEMQATLTVCATPSMSSPLMVNVREFLKTNVKQNPIWYLSEIIFHEMMHTYTRPVYTTSLLRKKYATEDVVVLNHLHVMALEKLVLQSLGRKENLQWLGYVYTNNFSPPYKRAWEIVNDIEGHEAFIKELQQLSK